MLEAYKFILEYEDYLNIVMDESGDIAAWGIINMCIVTPISVFYYVTDNSKDKSQPEQMLFYLNQWSGYILW